MTIAQLLEKMLAFSEGNIHDIDHFLRVWSYARAIGELEGLDSETQFILECAAISHDIACPLCRAKYGNTNGKYQDLEGEVLARDFLKDSGLSREQIDRIVFLIAHHHTFTGVEGLDWQVLLEADYLANATENNWSKQSAEQFLEKLCKTAAGARLIRTVLCIGDHQ